VNREIDATDPYIGGWMKARSLYPANIHGMPMPSWATRGFADDGTTAWQRLAQIIPERNGAFSIYAHLPFCRTRCPFCDCRATVMPRESAGIVAKYVARFQQEVRQWSGVGNLSIRPVTTVHLGGGTPHALHPSDFAGIVEALRSCFSTHEGTEWAIETSCRCLDKEHTDQLHRLGFTRIHVGLQTLQPRIRVLLGRRVPADTALSRIAACLESGWTVSADMLYGLPEQTAGDLVADLERLVKMRIHGVSLYRLNHGARNHRFMIRHGLADRGEIRLYSDYQMFMEAAALLTSSGYVKNHFTHFATDRDQNLYSRHAIRGEDLLALGTTSDGVFGDYCYRHGELAAYLDADGERPPLQGGGDFTLAERRARPLVTQLMAGQVLADGLDIEAIQFVARLAAADLLHWEAESRSWRLTNTGSWFIGQCAADALHIYESSMAAE
jgi:coproporphyrinogen III oxidase-like Fe-S oxidoreductase